MDHVNRYTCITCQIAFGSPDVQRAHYKTDWHRYNLKRRVAEMPPVTAETFQEKVLAIKMADELALEEKGFYCTCCHKPFASEKSFESHMRSRKHKEIAAKHTQTVPPPDPMANPTVNEKQETVEEEEESDGEPEPLELTECLFCPHYEDDMESNIHHMSCKHGFFIPEVEYLTDLNGLMGYLGEKVGIGNMCLYCNDKGKSFYSVEAAQHHMIDKGHCKINFEGDAALEFAEYYDFSKSYPDRYEEDKPLDEVIEHSAIKINNDLELVLPSGVTLGHRYLKNYYKQHLPSYEQRKVNAVGRVMAKYRALGWKGSSYGGLQGKRDKGWALKMRQQKEMQLGVKANKLQRHFRPQVIF